MNREAAILYQLRENSPRQMMSYVLQNSDRQIAVIDGGNYADGEALFRFLKEIGGPHPIVEKWFLTHFHADHINALVQILRDHGRELDIHAIYLNFPSAERALRESPEEWETVSAFVEARRGFADREILLRTGDVIPFGNIRFKVLFMPDDSIQTNVVNNCSTVLRCDIGSQRVMFLADLGSEVSERFLAMWPEEELRSDLVQMAHHGQGGVTKAVYAAIRPRASLWPTPKWLWENDSGAGPNSGPWKTLEVRQWMQDLGVTRRFISHEGPQQIRFPLEF